MPEDTANWAGFPTESVRGTRTLHFDQTPAPYTHPMSGAVVGVHVMVRLFDGDTEVRVDPHRVIINPPQYVTGTSDEPSTEITEGRHGRTQVAVTRARVVDPVAALVDAVWASIDSAPAPQGWGTKGTVTSFYADEHYCGIWSDDETYTAARAGGQWVGFSTDLLPVGQYSYGTGYECIEGFIAFDTSVIPDDRTVTAVTLSMLQSYHWQDPQTVEVYDHDWGPEASLDQWVPGASISGLTMVASCSDFSNTTTRTDFTSETAFLTVSGLKTGWVQLMCTTSTMRTGVAPEQGSDQDSYWVDGNLGVWSSSQIPVLTVTTTGDDFAVVDATCADSIEEIPEVEPVPATSLSVAQLNSGVLVSHNDASYSLTRSGSSVGLAGITDAITGQRFISVENGHGYYCYQTLAEFTIPTIPAGHEISAATLRLYTGALAHDNPTITIEVREYDYGDALSTADWVPCANLSQYTLLATHSGVTPSTSQIDCVAEPDLLAHPSMHGGTLRTIITISSMRLGETPTSANDELYQIEGGYPRLIISHVPSYVIVDVALVEDIDTADDEYIGVSVQYPPIVLPGSAIVLVCGADRIPVTDPVPYTSLTAEIKLNAVGTGEFEAPAEPALVDAVSTPGNTIVVIYGGGYFAGGPIEKPGCLPWDATAGIGTIKVNFATWERYLADRITYPDPTVAAESQVLTSWAATATNAETVMRDLVTHNAGPAALTPRVVPGLVLGASSGASTSIDLTTRFEALTDVLRKAATMGGGLGWRVRLDGPLRSSQLLFEVYTPRDLSTDVIFSRSLGNVLSLSTEPEAPTATVAIVGGDGAGGSRAIVERSDPSAVAGWGRVEKWVNQSSTATTPAEMQQAGDAALVEFGEDPGLSCTAVDSSQARYGDYGLGDIVGIETGVGVFLSGAVTSVKLTSTPDKGDTVTPTIGRNPRSRQASQARDVERRMARIERS